MGDGGVVPIFLDRVLRTGEPVTIFGDGEQTRDFVYVADAARAVILGLSAKLSGSWNIGTGEERTVNQLWADVQRLYGAQHPTLHAPERLGEVRRSALDYSVAAQDLGWQPQVTWQEGLRATYSWYAGNSER
jgi:UDP-glucose 4-epimerase